MHAPSPGGHAPSRNWIFVCVETDEGIAGTGEATTENHEKAVVAMIEDHFAPLLIGQDPTRVHYLWQQMHRLFWWRGGVLATSAASGIEQALWDVTGKAVGLPVYKLLGGAVRDHVRLYARMDLGLPTHADEIHAAIEEGYDAFKDGPGIQSQPFDDRKLAENTLSLMRELREAGGSACDLMCECSGIFSRKSAYRLIEGLQELNPLFVEEPTNADVPEGLVELRRAFPGIRMAAGERLATRWQFRQWFEKGAVDVAQPDVSHCGGIGELLRIANYAEIHGIQIAPHGPYGPVALAAASHACAAMPNFLILEHCRLRPWFDEVQKFGPKIENGRVLLPDRPGLGVELDWDYVEKHPYKRLSPEIISDRDGGLPMI